MQTKVPASAVNYAVLGVVFLLLLFPDIAAAANADGGQEVFGEMYNTLKGWITGVLGKLIALACFTVGLAIGVVKQSIMATVVGIAMALALFYGPALIENVFAATLLVI